MEKIDIAILVKRLNEASDAYYNGREIMSDAEYDALYSQLVTVEKETGIVLGNSPTRNIGAKAKDGLPKIKHDIPMLSLDKITTIQEIINFIGDRNAVMSLKEDGLSIRLHYDSNGDLLTASTRGNGEVGTDITSNLCAFTNIPTHINSNGKECIIDGEAICTFDNFNRLNENMDEPYKHPRAVASGTVLLLDHNEAKKRKLNFIAWKFVKGYDHSSYTEQLRELIQFGFNVVPYTIVDIAYIQETISMLQDSAKKLSHPYDGIVIAIDDTSIWNSLGSTAHHPLHSKAYKFAQEAEETTITDFEFSCGKTGQLTPVAIFQTVTLDGTDVSRASCHNISYCKNLNLGIGAKVKVIKAMQIIPQIIECVEPGEGFKPVVICPICGAPTKIIKDNESEVLFCPNVNCKGKLLGKLVYAVSKKAFDIKNLSEATLEFLINKGWVSSIKDIYYLYNHQVEWERCEGFGKTSVNNILTAIEQSRHITLDKFICALSIPTIGSTASKLISDYCDGDFNRFVDLTLGFDKKRNSGFSWTSIPTFGETMSKHIDNWVDNYGNDMCELAEEMYFITNEKQEIKENPFLGKTIVVTGALTHFTRDTINDKIADIGAKTAGSVSKKTDYLLTNEASGSSKYRKAIELNIPVINEEKFLQMIGE